MNKTDRRGACYYFKYLLSELIKIETAKFNILREGFKNSSHVNFPGFLKPSPTLGKMVT